MINEVLLKATCPSDLKTWIDFYLVNGPDDINQLALFLVHEFRLNFISLGLVADMHPRGITLRQ